IEGKVLNPITQEGIEGVELWLLKPGSPFEYYGGYKRVETVFTDANGNFKVDVKSASAEILRVGNMHGAYYKIGWYEDGAQLPSDLPVQQGKNMKADFYAVPYGKLQINIKNINCEGPTDSLDVFFDGSTVLALSGNQDANNQIGSILIDPITGCWDNSNVLFTQMGERYYHWTVPRSGVSQTFYDTVFVLPNQTTALNVFY
ncbi:MAG: hypothetical protein WC994_04980, partial [Brumimicrobium sp.]